MKNFKWKRYAQKVLLSMGITGSILVSCQEDEVKENQLPIALFTVSSATATVGEELSFTDQSADPDGTVEGWFWNFGDGQSSKEQNPKHKFGNAGDFTIYLYVKDDRGDSTLYSSNVSIANFSLKWKFVTESGSSISPSAPAVADDGTIYLGSQDSKLYALTPTGTLKWAFTTGKTIRSTPAVATDGTIYIPSQDGKLYAVNPDGTNKWDITIGVSFLDASPSIATDGTIYLGGDDTKVYAVNADGTKKWDYTTGGKIRCSIAIASDNTLIVSSGDKKVYALNPDGSFKWAFTTTATVNSSPAIGADGTIYVGDDAGKFFAINPDGTQKWMLTAADNNPFLGSPSIGKDNVIYVGTKRGPTTAAAIFYAINPDGTEKWKHNFQKDSEIAPMLQSDVLGTPTIGMDGTIYITFNDGNLFAFKQDGTIKFQYKVFKDDPAQKFDQAMWTSPALTNDGVLYFADYSGIVYALQASATGLADSPWPTRGKNIKRTGK